MLINKIVKKNNGSYEIVFNDDFSIITYDDIIFKYNLLYKKDVSSDTLRLIICDNEFYNLYDKCIKYISKRYRSELEINNYLCKYTSNFDLIKKIIDKLKEKKYIDDYRFAYAYVNDKITFSKDGINKIKDGLINLGVNLNIIDDVLNKIDLKKDLSRLEKMIIKKINSNHKYSNNMLRQKIIYEFVNLGYDREDIIDIFDRNILNEDDIYLKEYNKIYNKLKNKYTSKELEFHVMQRLSSKGFSKK